MAGAAQLALKSVELGIVSTSGRDFTHEAGVPTDALHGLRSLGFQCKNPCASRLPPWLHGSKALRAVLKLQASIGTHFALGPTCQRALCCLGPLSARAFCLL